MFLVLLSCFMAGVASQSYPGYTNTASYPYNSVPNYNNAATFSPYGSPQNGYQPSYGSYIPSDSYGPSQNQQWYVNTTPAPLTNPSGNAATSSNSQQLVPEQWYFDATRNVWMPLSNIQTCNLNGQIVPCSSLSQNTTPAPQKVIMLISCATPEGVTVDCPASATSTTSKPPEATSASNVPKVCVNSQTNTIVPCPSESGLTVTNIPGFGTVKWTVNPVPSNTVPQPNRATTAAPNTVKIDLNSTAGQSVSLQVDQYGKEFHGQGSNVRTSGSNAPVQFEDERN